MGFFFFDSSLIEFYNVALWPGKKKERKNFYGQKFVGFDFELFLGEKKNLFL